MSDDQDESISKLSVARFHKNTDPAAHNPTAALDAAYEAIRSGENTPDHIIVLFGRTTENNGSAHRYFQAGNYSYHAQTGLCMEGMLMIRES